MPAGHLERYDPRRPNAPRCQVRLNRVEQTREPVRALSSVQPPSGFVDRSHWAPPHPKTNVISAAP
jgi:hypothetical protein